VITVRGIRKVFSTSRGDVVALDDANVEVGDEEFFVLLGPSGSGKTTLLRCVAGLENPDSGFIGIGSKEVFDGASKLNLPAEQRGLGMVFQSYAIWPHMTVAQNVALPLTHGAHRLGRSEAKERVQRALHAVQLDGLEDRPAPLLSGGQQQRVALARALAVDPSALLMDEPLSNLDARLREEVRFEIREVAKRVGVPVLYVTHDQAEAMALADRIGVMDQGNILQIDSPTAIYDNPANSTVASFLGSMNWIDGVVKGKGKIETALGDIISARATENGKVHVGIRPENLQFTQGPAEGANSFAAKVVEASFLGDHHLFKMDVQSHSFTARTTGMIRASSSGDEGSVHFPEESVLVFPAEGAGSSIPSADVEADRTRDAEATSS
jgi:iron(III) transport system ATP-binding protein